MVFCIHKNISILPVVNGQIVEQIESLPLDQVITEESIVSFDSYITVSLDNSIRVVETIVYNTGPQKRHGIYRDIYPFSSTGRKMSINNITVTDPSGTGYQYQETSSGDNIRLKIGNPSQTFSGLKIYVITYRATQAVGQLKKIDEIYWNVTGNNWEIPIYKATAVVVLPTGVEGTQSACYFGPKGSQTKCQITSSDNHIYNFIAPKLLKPKDGLTVAVGFPKGLVVPYTFVSSVSNFWDIYQFWFLLLTLPILTLFFSLKYWYKKGRDPKGSGVIIPQYDVPAGLTPLEVSGIVFEKIQSKDFSAEIIYLATKGYIKIQQLEKKYIGFIKFTDYELIKLKETSDLPNEFDKKLMASLFLTSAQSVKLSKLKKVFYKEILEIYKLILPTLKSKGYYKNFGRMNYLSSEVSNLGDFARLGLIILGILIYFIKLDGNGIKPLFITIFLSVIIFGIIFHFSPAKTVNGVKMKEYLLGLKYYLQIAEKDRLIFHNAPEKKPEVFEKLLPYAMVLGVADIWAKEFEDIYMAPPAWFSGVNGSNFNAVVLGHSLAGFSSHMISSMSAPGSSGGGGSG